MATIQITLSSGEVIFVEVGDDIAMSLGDYLLELQDEETVDELVERLR